MSGGQHGGGRRYVTMAEYAQRVELEAGRYVAAIRNGGLTLKELKQSGVNEEVFNTVCRKLAESTGSTER